MLKKAPGDQISSDDLLAAGAQKLASLNKQFIIFLKLKEQEVLVRMAQSQPGGSITNSGGGGDDEWLVV